MSYLTVEGRPDRIPLSPVVSILNHLLRNGVPVQHVCGGKMQCGTCRILILEGVKTLSPMKETERARLDAVGAGPGWRLACQTYAAGDVTIRIPEPQTGKS